MRTTMTSLWKRLLRRSKSWVGPSVSNARLKMSENPGCGVWVFVDIPTRVKGFGKSSIEWRIVTRPSGEAYLDNSSFHDVGA